MVPLAVFEASTVAQLPSVLRIRSTASSGMVTSGGYSKVTDELVFVSFNATLRSKMPCGNSYSASLGSEASPANLASLVNIP